MDIQNEIIKTIDLMIEKRLDEQNLSRDVQSVVIASGQGGYVTVVEGVKRTLPCALGMTLVPGVSVWVRIPNNDISKAYICGTVKEATVVTPGIIETVNTYDPTSTKAISGMGVAAAFSSMHETEDIDWS